MTHKNIIKALIALAIGAGIGWGVASYQARRTFKEITEKWTPEFQELVEQGVAIGKTMTKDERQELLEASLRLSDKLVNDWNTQAYAKAWQSLIVVKLLKNGEVAAAIESSESCLKQFLMLYDERRFEGDINEKQADKLVEAISQLNTCANQPH